MSAVKRALQMLKNPDVSALSDAFVLADSHKLVWAAMCLASGCVLHDVISPSFLPVILAVFALCACYSAIRRRLSLSFCLVAGIAGLIASEAEIRAANHIMLAEPVTASLTGIVLTKAVRSSGRLSVTLGGVSSPDPRLDGLNKVRFSIGADKLSVLPGDKVSARVSLFPLSPPAFAGRPDYACNQFLSGLSATGFAYQAHLVKPQADKSWPVSLNRWRHQFAAELSARMGLPYGGLAAALLVGVRDDIPPPVYDQFRASGLAHLLAISGLHMGLFCLSVLMVIRAGFACFPALCQRWSPRRFAAIIALMCGFGYLLISGGPVSAIRAFVMAMIILLAVLADRPAFTLRNLALAAFCLLLVSPSSVYAAGFQLSFVASFAIIAGLEMVGTHSPDNRYLRYVFFILLTSALAGLVTVPFIAYHFGQFTLWGILANLIALPLTAFFIMPAGILVLLCEGAGLSGCADQLMIWPLHILTVTAAICAGLPYAGSFLAPPPVFLLILFTWALVSLSTPGLLYRVGGYAGLLVCGLIWAERPDYQAAVFFVRGPVLAVVASSGAVQTTVPVSGWWQDNLRLALERPVISNSPAGPVDQIYLVRRRGQLSAACDSDADLIITFAEPLYPCRTGRPLVFVVPKERESWLIQLPDEATGAVPPLLSNLPKQRRPWRRLNQ